MRSLFLFLFIVVPILNGFGQDSSKVEIKDTSNLHVQDSSNQLLKIWNVGYKQPSNFNKRQLSAQFGIKKGSNSVLIALGYASGFQSYFGRQNYYYFSLFGIKPSYHPMPGVNFGFKYRHKDYSEKRSYWYTELSMEGNEYFSSGLIVIELDYSQKLAIEIDKGNEFGFGISRGYCLPIGKQWVLRASLGYDVRLVTVEGTILEATDNFTGEIQNDYTNRNYTHKYQHGSLFAQLQIEYFF